MVVDNSLKYLPPTRLGFRKRLFFLKNNLTYRYLKSVLALNCGRYKEKDLRWLDLGCGPGNLDRQLEKWYPEMEIYGVDQSEVLLDYARDGSSGTKYLHGSAEAIPFPDDSVDIVSVMQVMEHVEDPEIVLREINRVLKVQGLLVLTTPNLTGLGARVMKRKWQGYSDVTHVSLAGYCSWVDNVQNNGFEILSSGTTLFSGVPIMKIFPLSLLWQPWQILFGYFPWKYGESVAIIARKK